MEIIETVTKIIEPALCHHQLQLFDMEYVQEKGEYYLRIYVEKEDGSLDMDTCVAVSEEISDLLDQHDPIRHEYYLEVSSPGAERPIKTYDQLLDSIGQYVYIAYRQSFEGRDEIEGTILDVHDQDIRLEYHVKNIKKTCIIHYENVKFMRLAIKF